MRTSTILLFVLLLVPTLGFAHDATSTATSDILVDTPTKAKRVDDPGPVAPVGVLEDALDGSCTLVARNRGIGRKGVKGSFRALLVDALTLNTIRDLGTASGKTNKEGVLTVQFPVAPAGGFSQLVGLATELDLKGGKKITSATFSCTLVDQTP